MCHRKRRSPEAVPKLHRRRNPRMRLHRLLRIAVLIVLIFGARMAHSQQTRYPDCITGSDGGCRDLARRQVSNTNAANTLTITAPNVGRTMAITSTCSAGTAAVTVTVSTDNFANSLTIDTLAAAATVTKQYDVTTPGAGLALSPLVFPAIRISVATCGAGNTSTLYVAIKGI